MKSLRKTILLSALAASFITLSGLAQARDLTIALRSEPSSMDPQFHSLTPNTQLSETLFDPLVRTDGNAKPVPSLAESRSEERRVGNECDRTCRLRMLPSIKKINTTKKQT